jgi:thioredoxin 1
LSARRRAILKIICSLIQKLALRCNQPLFVRELQSVQPKLELTMFRTALLVAAVAITAPATAAQSVKFERGAFEAAKAAGMPILVDVKAWWCPVCASQGRTIKATTTAADYRNLIIFSINYDNQKEEWKRLGALKQSTLIGYRGGKEVGRVAYTTDKTQINALLASIVR